MQKVFKREIALIVGLTFALLSNVYAIPAIESVDTDDFTSGADTTQIYNVVDQMPEIIGGLNEIYKHIKYPAEAKRQEIEGRVFIRFVVDETGKVSSPQILKDIGGGCGEAAIEGVQKVSFKPGMHQGKPVKVYYSLPVNFKIQY